jgi:CHAD domain-containing protein
MLAALATLEKRDLPGRLQRFLRDEADAYRVGLLPAPEWRPAAVSPTQPFRAAAPPILEERLAELLAFEPHVEHPEDAAELHEMRIKAKWLRYTRELFAPAYADGLKKPLAAVKKLQELLGDLHDSDVRLWLLDDMLGAPLRAAGLEALGLLNPDPVKEGLRALRERESGERQACYIAFRREWRRLARADFPAACLARIRNADG